MPAIAAYALQFVRVSVSKLLFRARVVQPCCRYLCYKDRGWLVSCNNDVKTYHSGGEGTVPITKVAFGVKKREHRGFSLAAESDKCRESSIIIQSSGNANYPQRKIQIAWK